MILALLLTASDVPQDARAPLLIDRDRIDRARPAEPLKTPAPTPPVQPRVAALGSETIVTGIRFRGVKAPAPVAAAAKAFVGRRADTATLQALATALSEAYGRSDVALYTVAIPQQDFARGIVNVLLTEATIITANVRAAPGKHPRLRERMAPLLGQKPLSRRTFERQLTLMRSLPGLTVEPDFTDPAMTGELTLTVTPRQRRNKLSAGFSNRGVDLLGAGQFDARAEFYGVARDGDQVSIAGSAATDLKRYRYASAGYAVSVAARGTTLSATAAYLETRPRGLPITGTAKLAGLTLSDPILRNFHQSGDISLAFDGINSDNALFGNIIASERTRAVRIAGGFTDSRERRSTSVSGSLSQGVDVFGAQVTAPFAETGFTKATLNTSLAQAIGKRGALRLNLSGQYSLDALPAAERFAIGGEAIGRAFDTGLLTGDRGAGGLAEFAWRPVGGTLFANSEVYGFVDGGRVGVTARGASPRTSYDLASAGIGGRLRYRQRAEIGLEAARAINDPFAGYSDDWRLSIAWRLTR